MIDPEPIQNSPEDAERLAELLGVDEITANFIIAIEQGEIDGDVVVVEAE